MLDSWTDGRISCRQSKPISLFVVTPHGSTVHAQEERKSIHTDIYDGAVCITLTDVVKGVYRAFTGSERMCASVCVCMYVSIIKTAWRIITKLGRWIAHDKFWYPFSISVGAQSTLGGQDIFARKYMHEKLTKCPNFTWYMPEKKFKNVRILHDFCQKIFSRFFLGGRGQLPPCPPVSYAYAIQFEVKRSQCQGRREFALLECRSSSVTCNHDLGRPKFASAAENSEPLTSVACGLMHARMSVWTSGRYQAEQYGVPLAGQPQHRLWSESGSTDEPARARRRRSEKEDRGVRRKTFRTQQRNWNFPKKRGNSTLYTKHVG